MNNFEYTLQEGLNVEEYVMATYFIGVKPEADILQYAESIAFEQTTGTWVKVPEETEDVREKYGGKVIGIYEVPAYEYLVPKEVQERRFIIRIAYPIINFGHNFPLLLTTVLGNISSLGIIKLIDVEFPPNYVQKFKGPKFGIEGIRKILGAYNRPLVLNMIKPCTGFTPEVGARLFYEAGKGGVDVIKDDELIADPSFCPLKIRIKKYMEQCRRIYEESGKKILYTPNITSRPDKILDLAKEAVDAGANALMINYLTVGIGAIEVLAESDEVPLPILGHSDFAGALYESPFSGVSSTLLQGKFPRLLGLDMVLVLNPYGKFPFLRDQYLKVCQNLRSRFFHLKPIFPMIGGGVHPGVMDKMINDLGIDFIIGAGGAIHGHPQGPSAGTKAFFQAIEAVLSGIKLEEAAQGHEELAKALRVWK
jgi:2,3-diketo-5-methylthiopentyl-1-phosphate enolase